MFVSSYYHCANGRPYAGSCPAGLLWNGVKQECDFPENVNCDISIGEAARFKVSTSTASTALLDWISNMIMIAEFLLQVPGGSFVYMTFDDGPNEGTPYVLDALKQVHIVIVKLIRAPCHRKLITCHNVSGGSAGNLLHQLGQPAHGRPGRGRQEQGVPHPHGEETRVARPRVRARSRVTAACCR